MLDPPIKETDEIVAMTVAAIKTIKSKIKDRKLPLSAQTLSQ
jgi:hypothetical protein